MDTKKDLSKIVQETSMGCLKNDEKNLQVKERT